MNYYTEILGIKETDKGTDLIVRIPGEKVKHKIIKVKNGNVINSEIKIDDNRIITSDQRKKIYATIKDISDFLGEWPSYYKEFLKFNFCFKNNIEYFSLSDCSISIAREFITYLIGFIIEHDIPLSDLAINRVEDIDKYIYGCLKRRKCAITGKPNADIHHCTGSTVGMGRNRKKINHKGLEIIPLIREWHNKVHAEGEEEIFAKFKIYGIIVDEETLKNLRLNYEDIS